ncbi:hypothetical protein FQN60_016787 [Etheostoma spectabile]|uniref:Uncharacterized protein n=1 Tax=Etheostoma spectabile TaxID=54343 RepID=A0A5J5C6K1_9PERO|nr:hypothetical protein FQN60_016787 [Etheostoma spectabile]
MTTGKVAVLVAVPGLYSVLTIVVLLSLIVLCSLWEHHRQSLL